MKNYFIPFKRLLKYFPLACFGFKVILQQFFENKIGFFEIKNYFHFDHLLLDVKYEGARINYQS